MSYNLIYGAWPDTAATAAESIRRGTLVQHELHQPSQRLALRPTVATPYLWLFDPGNASWQSYIFNAEKNADDVYAFDGWQAGRFRKSARSTTAAERRSSSQ